MRKVIYALFIGFMALLFGTALTSPVTTHAAEIQVSGLGAADAIIKDANGQNVTNSTSFNKYQDYTVNYNWSIPDGVKVAGNTSTVTVPAGLEPNADISFDIKDANGTVVGTFKIQAGSSTGTITYNEAADNAANRTGSLSFHATGSNDNNNHGSGWTINKIGWISGQDSKGTPTELTWNVAFNSKSASIGTITITDTLGPNQTFIPGSVVAPTGDYDAKGNFIPDGGSLTPDVSVNGQTITFTFKNVEKAVDMTYKTKPQLTDNDGKWTNTAYSSNGGTVSATVSWGGSGSGSGDALGSVILNKTAPDGSKLAGAVYKLLDAKGNVVIPELVTDDNGQLSVKGMNPGNYSLVEVSAPAGYTVNTTPHDFTIVAGVTTPVTVSAIDNKDTDLGGVPDKGSVTVNKKGADGQALPGAVFKLVDATGKVIKENMVTDNEGHLYIPGLAAGTYTLIETQAPEGYEVNEKPIEFTIPETGNQNATVTVTDEKTPGEPGNPGEPGEPTPPTGPTEPGNPGEPTPPTGPTTPTEPGAPGEPTPPTGPTTPTEPGAPGEPTPPTEPTTPTEPGAPGEPTPPTGPTTPTGPSAPGEPTPPTGPTTPTNPSIPGTTTPTTPTTPAIPGTATPVTPGTPSVTTPGVMQPGQGSAGATGTPSDGTAGSAAIGNGQGTGTTGAAATGELPQTSEQQSPLAVIIGLISLIGLGLFGWFHKPLN
ncbi:LPXTG cell wall anchor domain-containing protein [Levilactobacillus spicheri]|nr:LPXTG cell wall anchor domain-containing protein [Levilactobacillus spicheri]